MKEITSKDNTKLKTARKVASGKIPDRIFIEGLRLTSEALNSDIKIDEVFLTKDFADKHPQTVSTLSEENISAYYLSEPVFSSIAETKTSQGIVLVCVKPESGKHLVEKELERNTDKIPVIVLLHKVNNPSNLGAVLRTAEAAGVVGVAVTETSASVFSPKALRGSMGASLRLPVWDDASFDAVISWASENGLTTTCADVNSRINYYDADWKIPRLLVFGSEAHGLSPQEIAKIDESVIIPMEANVESLNLAVSSGIILYEIKRQFYQSK